MTSMAVEVSVRPIQSLRASNVIDDNTGHKDERRRHITRLSEQLDWLVNDDNCDHNKCNQLIASLCHCIKSDARHLEEDEPFKHQMDVYFNLYRNVLRNVKLNAISRALILEVIELRAANWTDVDQHIDKYYTKKLADLKANSDSSHSKGVQSSDVNDSSKSSAKSAKVGGKTSLRHEVVIRNSDSGKVMGIKGRRVHMIEEMSQTVISFQKVPIGTKERVVQISGQSEENIETAKRLMEDTIKRNTSPVPFESSSLKRHSTISDLNVDESDDVVDNEKTDKILKNDALIEAKTASFTFTVTVGNAVIHLSTDDYNIGLKAKKVLDEHLVIKYGSLALNNCMDNLMDQQIGCVDRRQPLIGSNGNQLNELDKEIVNQQQPKPIEAQLGAFKWDAIDRELAQLQTYSSQATVANESISLAMASDLKSSDIQRNITYDREFLLSLAESPFSSVMFEELARIRTEIPAIIRNTGLQVGVQTNLYSSDSTFEYW